MSRNAHVEAPFRAEFQAVILAAGKGSRMPEVVSGKPKCLIPVGPKPLIWYPLNKLKTLGFTECIVIVLENQRSEIQATVDKITDLKIEYQCIPSNEDFGTADSLRLIHDKLHTDVFVLPCDLVSDIDLIEPIDTFRKNIASVVSVYLQPQSYGDLLVPGPKSKYKPERDLVGVDVQTSRLVFLASASDFEEEVGFPMALLKKHTHIKVYSTLVDSHIYIIRKWVVDYLNKMDSFSTLKGEFIPHLVKKQLSKQQKVLELQQSIICSSDEEDIYSFSNEKQRSLLIREMSSANDHYGDSRPIFHGDEIRCYACIVSKDTFGLRVNTVPSYCLIREKIMDKWDNIVPNEALIKQNPKAEIKSTQIDDKCIIWEGAKLNEKTSFKNSVIAANVEVNSFSRVFNCILMKNVVIREKVALENCIIADNAIIGTGCQLKSCIIGNNFHVPDQSVHTSEVLMDSDRLMEL